MNYVSSFYKYPTYLLFFSYFLGGGNAIKIESIFSLSLDVSDTFCSYFQIIAGFTLIKHEIYVLDIQNDRK